MFNFCIHLCWQFENYSLVLHICICLFKHYICKRTQVFNFKKWKTQQPCRVTWVIYMVKSPIQGNNPQKLRIDLLVQEIIAILMNTTVDIKILWWIHNCLIVHDKIFAIKLISNWWRGQSTNEIKPRGEIKWRKPYGRVKRKDLYGKFLLNEISN